MRGWQERASQTAIMSLSSVLSPIQDHELADPAMCDKIQPGKTVAICAMRMALHS